MINPIWLAPVVAGVAYLYFKWEDRKWEVSISSFWNKELERVDEREVHGFMTMNPPILSEENGIKLAIINVVRDLIIEIEKRNRDKLVDWSRYSNYLHFRHDGMKVTFSLNKNEKFVYSIESDMTRWIREDELDFVNDLLTDKDKQTIQNYKEFLANGG